MILKFSQFFVDRHIYLLHN